MENTYQLNIKANEGYSAERVKERNKVMTVGELIDMLEDLDRDAVIVTNDLNNQRGANFGAILEVEEVSEEDE